MNARDAELRGAIVACRKITAAARELRGTAEYPKCTALFIRFYPGDRRFPYGSEVLFYIDAYLKESRAADLDTALQEPRHVRELLEVITK